MSKWFEYLPNMLKFGFKTYSLGELPKRNALTARPVGVLVQFLRSNGQEGSEYVAQGLYKIMIWIQVSFPSCRQCVERVKERDFSWGWFFFFFPLSWREILKP